MADRIPHILSAAHKLATLLVQDEAHARFVMEMVQARTDKTDATLAFELDSMEIIYGLSGDVRYVEERAVMVFPDGSVLGDGEAFKSMDDYMDRVFPVGVEP